MGNWMPGAIVISAVKDAGTPLGGEAYVTWHSFEANPNTLSASAGAKYLNRTTNTVHLVFNPVSGHVVQMIPANRMGRGLQNKAGGVQTNRAGRVHIQIEVIGYAKSPWTALLTPAGKIGLARILAWLDSLGIPRVAPAGQPAGSYAGPHNRIAPGKGGHYTHSQWKENVHWDHGAIKWADLWAALPKAGTPITSTPKPPVPLPTKPPAATTYNRSTIYALQAALRLSRDGKWGPNTDRVASHFRNAAYPTGKWDVRTVQRAIGVTVDGKFGPKSRAALVRSIRAMQTLLKVKVDGDWGPATDKAFWVARSALRGRY